MADRKLARSARWGLLRTNTLGLSHALFHPDVKHLLVGDDLVEEGGIVHLELNNSYVVDGRGVEH